MCRSSPVPVTIGVPQKGQVPAWTCSSRLNSAAQLRHWMTGRCSAGGAACSVASASASGSSRIVSATCGISVTCAQYGQVSSRVPGV